MPKFISDTEMSKMEQQGKATEAPLVNTKDVKSVSNQLFFDAVLRGGQRKTDQIIQTASKNFVSDDEMSKIESPTEEKKPGVVRSGLGLFFNPIMESGVRLGQAVGGLGLKAADKLTGGKVSAATPEGDIDEALARVLDTEQSLPLTKGKIRPASEITPKSEAGRALTTVFLGVGNPALSGAGVGAGEALEREGNTYEVVRDTLIGALTGKVLAVGLERATPFVTKALARYGTPVVEDLQKVLPDYAKPYLQKLVSTGNKTLRDLEGKAFQETVDSGLIKEPVATPYVKTRASAWEDIQPKLTTTTKTEYGKQGAVSERGLFSKARLEPTSADEPVLSTYQKLYNDGSIKPDMSIKQKASAVEQKSSQLHQQQKSILAENDKAVPLKTDKANKGILDVLKTTSDKNTLIFASDTQAKGAYNDAIEVFKRNLATGKNAGTTSNSTTLTKLDESLTAFDREMEKFKAWERSKTGQLTETDRARIQAIRDVHTTVRNYIAEQLPKNSPWVAIRKEESNLIEAGNRLADNLGETVGTSSWSDFWKAHPRIRDGVLLGAGGASGGLLIRGVTE